MPDAGRRDRVGAGSGHELVGDSGRRDDVRAADPSSARIDDATVTVERDQHVDEAATVEVAGRGDGADSGAETAGVTVTIRTAEDTVTVELTRPAATALRAELDDALLEAQELTATHQ